MTVIVPAGLPLLDAARWVGGSCWLELHVHELITDVLAGAGLDHEARVALWRVRANRAEAAEAWYRRLPELRELPRETFVAAPDGSDVVGPAQGVEDLLAALDRRYAAHEPVAVGPADGPVAATLGWARTLVARDLAALNPAARAETDPGPAAPAPTAP